MCRSCQQALVSVNALTMSFVLRACNCGQAVLRCVLKLADGASCLGRVRLYPSHPGYSSNRAANRCLCRLLRKSGQTCPDRIVRIDHRRLPESSLFYEIRTAPYDRVTSRIILLQSYSQAPQETATSNRHQSRGTCPLLTPLHVDRKLQV